MIVIGIDPHMKSHVAVAVDAASGRRLAETCVGSDAAGCEALLSWARGLGEERLIAVEDCRHVSGRLERQLLPHGERLVRVPPKLMARARLGAHAGQERRGRRRVRGACGAARARPARSPAPGSRS